MINKLNEVRVLPINSTSAAVVAAEYYSELTTLSSRVSASLKGKLRKVRVGLLLDIANYYVRRYMSALAAAEAAEAAAAEKAAKKAAAKKAADRKAVKVLKELGQWSDHAPKKSSKKTSNSRDYNRGNTAYEKAVKSLKKGHNPYIGKGDWVAMTHRQRSRIIKLRKEISAPNSEYLGSAVVFSTYAAEQLSSAQTRAEHNAAWSTKGWNTIGSQIAAQLAARQK